MAKKVTCMEVKTAEGKNILTLYLYEKEVAQDAPQNTKGVQTPGNSGGDDLMTDAQKRYLFRILAEQGFEGDKAHEHLKELFGGVESLKDVSKQEASRVIESLLDKAERR